MNQTPSTDITREALWHKLGEMHSDIRHVRDTQSLMVADVESLKHFRTRVKATILTAVTLGGIVGYKSLTNGGT